MKKRNMLVLIVLGTVIILLLPKFLDLFASVECRWASGKISEVVYIDGYAFDVERREGGCYPEKCAKSYLGGCIGTKSSPFEVSASTKKSSQPGKIYNYITLKEDMRNVYELNMNALMEMSWKIYYGYGGAWFKVCFTDGKKNVCKSFGKSNCGLGKKGHKCSESLTEFEFRKINENLWVWKNVYIFDISKLDKSRPINMKFVLEGEDGSGGPSGYIRFKVYNIDMKKGSMILGDLNNNGIIERNELAILIVKWINDEISRQDLAKAIQNWIEH